nr:probable bifunctional methylthioribulose-1-phosphate dehydratase/enolase-phosphatase E1 1 [Ipomoea batatas]
MRLRHFELRLISAPLPLPRHDATVHHCHQLPSLRLPLNPPQSPVVSPLRLHQSPPSSRRLASVFDWCFSSQHLEEDLQNGVAGAVPIRHDDAGKEEVIAALVTNVEAMIKADRKITSLKQLQVHIWRTGFQHNKLEAIVYDDVPEALEKWNALGIKVYIYSSGSRLAQRLLFGNTNHGDLRNFLCGFFDTTVGNKKEMKSYIEITESLGVDNPSEILFVTDVYQEATAALDQFMKRSLNKPSRVLVQCYWR